MKIPDIAQQPVGEFALGNIRQPNYQALGTAIGEFVAVTGEAVIDVLQDADTQLSKSTAGAANDLSELRAKLEESNTVSTAEIPDNLTESVYEIGAVLDIRGERVEIGQPRVFTHYVADEWWQKQGQEIIQYWADQIKNNDARAEFLEEMGTRYFAPGTLAINKATLAKRRAHNQATAENAIRDVIASVGPKEQREEQALKIIARQEMLGADPVWADRQRKDLGPRIDQLEIQNEIFAADSEDQINLIEERMYSTGTRMSPEQTRTMGSQMDIRRREFLAEKRERQAENTDKALYDYINPDIPFNEMTVADLLNTDAITYQQGWPFLNALRGGGTTSTSDPVVLSLYRGAITTLPYTGNRARVRDRATLLKMTIARASQGLNPNGTPTGLPARITGDDAFKLIKDVDGAVTKALESDAYRNALKEVYTWTHVAVDLEGQITIALGGNQHQVDAALAFKRGLDNYMNQFGADAKPVEYVEANRKAFNPNNFVSGVNARFFEEVPQAARYMEIDVGDDIYNFNRVQQENFVMWLDSQRSSLGAEEFKRIYTLFGQFYRGKGLAPEDGKLALEPDDPFYRQFEALLE